MWMEVLVLGFPSRRFKWLICAQIKTAKRKIASIKQFIKAEVYSQGGSEGVCHKMELTIGSSGVGYLTLCTGRSCIVTGL